MTGAPRAGPRRVLLVMRRLRSSLSMVVVNDHFASIVVHVSGRRLSHAGHRPCFAAVCPGSGVGPSQEAEAAYSRALERAAAMGGGGSGGSGCGESGSERGGESGGSVILLNRALCRLKLAEAGAAAAAAAALEDCEAVLRAEPGQPKALYRCVGVCATYRVAGQAVKRCLA
jgi:hypothetical protein